MMDGIKGALFDLDGVLVDTARFHYIAWKRLAESLGTGFDEARNEELKGVSRMESLERILAWGGLSMSSGEKDSLAGRKNDWYLELVDSMGPGDLLDGARSSLDFLRNGGMGIALGSASKNARRILDRVGLTVWFDAIIDGTRTKRSKPDPEVFLLGASELGLAPGDCVVFEDSAAGVEAARRAGMAVVGIGTRRNLPAADLVVPSLAAWLSQCRVPEVSACRGRQA